MLPLSYGVRLSAKRSWQIFTECLREVPSSLVNSVNKLVLLFLTLSISRAGGSSLASINSHPFPAPYRSRFVVAAEDLTKGWGMYRLVEHFAQHQAKYDLKKRSEWWTRMDFSASTLCLVIIDGIFEDCTAKISCLPKCRQRRRGCKSLPCMVMSFLLLLPGADVGGNGVLLLNRNSTRWQILRMYTNCALG